MRRLTVNAVIVTVLCVSCKKQESNWANVVGERAQISSRLPLTAPSGWSEKTVNGITALFGPTHDGFRANIVMVIDSDSMKLERYVDIALKDTASFEPNEKLLERSSFETTGGAKGIRCISLSEEPKRKLRQTVYFFDASDSKKHIFTCTVNENGADELAPVFDSIIKTYNP